MAREEIVRAMWGVLQASPRYPYWPDGVVGLARVLKVSRRSVLRGLHALAVRGLIVFKNDRRGRGAKALIRVRTSKKRPQIHGFLSKDSGEKVDESLVCLPQTPSSGREGEISKDGRRRLNPKRYPQAYGWWGKAERWLRKDLGHALLARLVGRWIFWEGVPKAVVKVVLDSLHQGRRWLFRLTFKSARQAWRFFVWLLRWVVQRWAQTGRIWPADEVYAYARDLSVRPEKWERLLGEGPLAWARIDGRKRQQEQEGGGWFSWVGCRCWRCR